MIINNPAKVKYIGDSTNHFSKGHTYEAYFLEYWQGRRNSLHVRENSGEITDFNPFEDFEVISDPDGLLNYNEAIVECITHRLDGESLGLTYGKRYKAIGRDKDGLFLVMDDSYDCYFYKPSDFRIIEDKHEILKRESVYYAYHGSSL